MPIMHGVFGQAIPDHTSLSEYLWTAQTVLSNEVMYASQFCNSVPRFK